MSELRRTASCALTVLCAQSSLALCCLLWQLCAGSSLAADPRMRVVDVAAAQAQHHYAIIGAVADAGVYVGEPTRLTVSRLLEAAGGASQPALARVVRNGRLALQLRLPPAPGDDEVLSPGDVVVVVPATSATRPDRSALIPVACVGLRPEPVVLHLAPEIATVEELTRRLLQPQQLGQLARVLDPYGRPQVRELAPGAVVMFDPQQVDQVALSRTQPLPAPLSLEQALPLSRLPGENPLLSGSAQVPQSDLEEWSMLSESELLAPPAPPAQLPATARPVVVVEHTGVSTPDVNSAPTLPAPSSEMDRAWPLFAPMIESTAPHPPLQGIRQPAVEPGMTGSAGPERFTRTAHVEPSSFIRSADSSSSPTLELIDSAPVAARQSLNPSVMIERTAMMSPTGAIRPTPTVTAPVTASEPAPTTDGNGSLFGGAILLSVAVLAICCVAASILIPRSYRNPMTSQTERSQVVAPAAAPVAAAPKAEQPSGATAPDELTASVRSMLNRTLPVVEESVRLATPWPLHGEAIGHRRLILNGPHDQIPGPHFAAADQRARHAIGRAADSEQRLRQDLKQLLRTGAEPQAAHGGGGVDDAWLAEERELQQSYAEHVALQEAATAALPRSTPQREAVAPRSASAREEYDIVEPEQSRPHAPPTSPLERALRTLASEKRG